MKDMLAEVSIVAALGEQGVGPREKPSSFQRQCDAVIDIVVRTARLGLGIGHTSSQRAPQVRHLEAAATASLNDPPGFHARTPWPIASVVSLT